MRGFQGDEDSCHVTVFWVMTPCSDVSAMLPLLHFTLKMEVAWPSEMLVAYQNYTASQHSRPRFKTGWFGESPTSQSLYIYIYIYIYNDFAKRLDNTEKQVGLNDRCLWFYHQGLDNYANTPARSKDLIQA
jgi:hypothetical protein